MTIVESIKCVLQQNNDGLTSKQIYDEIIRQGLYSFGAENPVGVVNAQLRRRCIGLDFPTAYPIKFFEIAGYEGKKIKLLLLPKLQIFLNCYRKKKSKLRCRSIYKIYDNKYLILS